MSDRSKAKAKRLDWGMIVYMHDIRRSYTPQVRSNPVPSKPTYQWHTDADGNMVGVREGSQPIIIQAHTPAPARRITHDRGVIFSTLANGAGSIVTQGPRTSKARPKGWGALQSPRRHKGATVKHTPSWRQETAGRVDWRELVLPGRQYVTVFDRCRCG